MTVHRRAVIRSAIVSAITGLPTTGGNVTSGPAHPSTAQSLPGLSVITGPEEIEPDERIMIQPVAGKWLQDRSVEFSIECRASGDSVDGQIDQICLEVEQALNSDVTLGGLLDKLEPIGSSETDITGDVELPVGLRSLAYLARYRVDARDPQALED